MAKKRSNAAAPFSSSPSSTTSIAPANGSSTPPLPPPAIVLPTPEPGQVVKINKLNLSEVKGAFDEAIKKVNLASSISTREGWKEEGRKGTSSVLSLLLPLPAPSSSFAFQSRSSDLLSTFSWNPIAVDLPTSVLHSISSPSRRQARSGLVFMLDRAWDCRMEHQSRMGGEQTSVDNRRGSVSDSSLSCGRVGDRRSSVDAKDELEERTHSFESSRADDLVFPSFPTPSSPLLVRARVTATSSSPRSNGSTQLTSRRTPSSSDGGKRSWMEG